MQVNITPITRQSEQVKLVNNVLELPNELSLKILSYVSHQKLFETAMQYKELNNHIFSAYSQITKNNVDLLCEFFTNLKKYF
jgi:hypothetical protein